MDILLAICAGALVILSMSLNSGLSRRIGLFPATAVNYIVGLACAAAVVSFYGAWGSVGLGSAPWYSLGGALLGVAVVSASSFVLPRIPVVYTSVLLFIGQIAAGMALDAARGAPVDLFTIAGGVLIAAGMGLNLLADRRRETALAAATEPESAPKPAEAPPPGQD